MTSAIPINGQTWLICGGRKFSDQKMFDAIMGHLIGERGIPAKIVHGAASGADTMAAEFGRHLAITVLPFPAEWSKHGRAAGPIRNAEMLTVGDPCLVIAFPGGDGTADMISKAKQHKNVDVIEVKPINEVMASPALTHAE